MKNIIKDVHYLCKCFRYLMDVSPGSKRRKYSSFLNHNIASLKKNSMCEISKKNSSHCHLVYLNGGPAYPATGTFHKSFLIKDGRMQYTML